jgi:hypothetical protein
VYHVNVNGKIKSDEEAKKEQTKGLTGQVILYSQKRGLKSCGLQITVGLLSLTRVTFHYANM